MCDKKEATVEQNKRNLEYQALIKKKNKVATKSKESRAMEARAAAAERSGNELYGYEIMKKMSA